MIFDSNVLIYLSKYILKPEDIIKGRPAISVITKIETLGFQFKNPTEFILLSDLCNQLEIIQLTDEIATTTIDIRQHNKIKLPDAIIYATALVYKLPLLTHNTADFHKLGGGVKLIDPFTL